ncbi:Elongator complex protein 6 [Hanseniaspora osmophila]|uniref:Elongator complex protein 6 n=1 Tax=Hanseniaspora osmophila TaxID=56408 RepID=A0A1E5RHI9_9ASCO|nr:Elongator complex protein 6 [Hanseniaspora osmophila]
MVQKQDLIVFQDFSILPNNNLKNLVLLTYSLGTSPAWLIQALLEAVIFGEALSLNERSGERAGFSNDINSNDTGITLASFVHNQDYMEKHIFNKLKVQKTKSEKELKMVDLTTSLQIEKLSLIVEKIIENSNNTKTLILEQPEILLATMSSLDANALNQQLVDPLFEAFDTVVVVSNLDFYSPFPRSSKDLQFNKFVQNVFYKSLVNLNIKPLSTGRANDVTGTLSIVKGGDSGVNTNDKSQNVVENEYLFFTQRETTKLFYR